MKTRTRTRAIAAAAVIGAATVTGTATVTAAPKPPPPPGPIYNLPAGLACLGFDLKIELGQNPGPAKEFRDKDGNLVRLMTTGKGVDLKFTNVNTGATYSTKANGSNAKTTLNPDGSQTVLATGHNVIVLFPTDVPAGPSTTLYVGQVTYTVDAEGVFTITKVAGRTVDICDQLG